MNRKLREQIQQFQKNEISEHLIYKRLAVVVKGAKNKEILEKISEDELRHYKFWEKQTGLEVAPSQFTVWKYFFISRLFGITFGIKLMEKGEKNAQVKYNEISKYIPEAKNISEDEEDHEEELLKLLDEEKLKYMGAIVRGLNDALVELTGALAGFTLALRNGRLIAMVGLITGIAASMSMAGSEYLARKSEISELRPGKASFYTGTAYFFTVLVLIFPYLVCNQIYFALIWMFINAVLIIWIFNFYISIASDFSFKERFLEMAFISLGIAGLSFVIGYLLRLGFGIEI
jgi:vacuolar iron transporter family protein